MKKSILIGALVTLGLVVTGAVYALTKDEVTDVAVDGENTADTTVSTEQPVETNTTAEQPAA
jgi:hypothetical protein